MIITPNGKYEITKEEFKEFNGELMNPCPNCEEYTWAYKEGIRFQCLNCDAKWINPYI